jgi:hypothetical protein
MEKGEGRKEKGEGRKEARGMGLSPTTNDQ